MDNLTDNFEIPNIFELEIINGTLHISKKVDNINLYEIIEKDNILCFTKKFWEERKFDDIQIAEGNTFVQGREHMCRELSPQDVIVSLVHTKNSSSRKTPELTEPNGCHYGFNEKLFTLVTEIGKKLKGELT